MRRESGRLAPEKWAYPDSLVAKKESRRTVVGGSSLNREASRKIGEPIRERQHASPLPTGSSRKDINDL
jgi:hypothetical protein